MRDTGLVPGPGRPHTPWSSWAHAALLLTLCSRAWGPQLLSLRTIEPVLHKRSHPSEKPTPQLEKILCSNKDAAQLKTNTNKSNANLIKNRKSQQGNRNYKNNQIAFLELRNTVTKIKTLLDGLSRDDKE